MATKIEIIISSAFINAISEALEDTKEFEDPDLIGELEGSLAKLDKWSEQKYVEVNTLDDYFKLIREVEEASGNEAQIRHHGKIIEIGY